jgi:acyl-CoA reductase-like NAD-dependent aldehyde dehydrogenase
LATSDLAIPAIQGSVPSTSHEDLDAALATLRQRAPAWSALDIPARLELLEELIADTLAAGPAWAEVAADAKGIRRDSPLMGEEWGFGIFPVLRNLQLLRSTLSDIQTTGRPQPPSVDVAPTGQVVVTVVPTDAYDQVLWPGFRGEVRLQPGVTLDQALARMGRIYRPGEDAPPGVTLVLGAGNATSIPPMDALYQLFAEGHVVLIKMNPVNEHLGPHLGEAFQALVREGFLRIVYGGADVGAYLTGHDDVDAIHITGSSHTHDAIVFGPGEEGRMRKERGEARLDKPMTSELANITPVIVVPGPWSDKDVAYQGDNIASMMVHNGGFNCATARVTIQHRAWAKREKLLDAIRDSLRTAEERLPYYPGAIDRWERFVTEHRTAEWFGEHGEGRVPFTLIPDLDPTVEDDIAFSTESFCGILGEVALDAPRSVPEYIDEAVRFCNETLWGTLGATIIVHPRSLKDPLIEAAVERAIDDLRYGTVAVNHWVAAVGYGFVSTSWGAYPGSDPTDIQSGRGVVHNTYLLEDVEKSVVRGPFRFPVALPWFHNHRRMHQVLPALSEFTATRDPKALARLTWATVRG